MFEAKTAEISSKIDKNPEKASAAEMTAEEVSDRTFADIARQGYCLWTCELFKGGKIAVVLDKHAFDGPIRFTDPLRIAAQYPVFTVDELHHLVRDNASDGTWLMVREAKSLAPAWIELEEK